VLAFALSYFFGFSGVQLRPACGAAACPYSAVVNLRYHPHDLLDSAPGRVWRVESSTPQTEAGARAAQVRLVLAIRAGD